MNVHNLNNEKLCTIFADEFSNVNHNENISFSKIDTKQRSILTLSTHYGWHLQYWDSGLYRHLNERLQHGINLWDTFSHDHFKLAKNILHSANKIDICTKHDDCFELFSFTSNKSLSPDLIIKLGQLKPKVSNIANKIWRGTKDISLPLLENDLSKAAQLPTHKIGTSDKIRFGNVILTAKEMATIHCLLELKSIKEIARYHHCSEANERKRINIIKEKFNCANSPLSFLFNELRIQGVTLACLDAYIISQ